MVYFGIPDYSRRGHFVEIGGGIQRGIILKEDKEFFLTPHPEAEILYLDSIRQIHIQRFPKEFIKEVVFR